MGLSPINNASEVEAYRSIKRCCGAEKWVESMLKARPFSSIEDLFTQADKYLDQLTDEDWKEAFLFHPKIGDLDVLRKKFNVSAQWEAGEQAGVATATETLLKDLHQGNIDYEEKFGYIFIVCATGKTAEEMLAILKSRLPNNKEVEIKIAANEQRKITKLRLEKLCQ